MIETGDPEEHRILELTHGYAEVTLAECFAIGMPYL